MVELLCTLTGILSGIAIVAALLQQQSDQSRFESTAEPVTSEASECLKGLTTQLQLLTHRVAADVSAHTQKVVLIHEQLRPELNEPGQILSAINDLIHANESMQGQLAAAQQRLRKQSEQIEATTRQARTDALTGLANRRALDESLKNCCDAAGHATQAGLMLIDIDHFKSFNDNYGHTTGDAVLASFARSISKWCNGKYYSARYGGEEFAIILTGNSCADLGQLAAAGLASISGQAVSHEDLRITLTASAGLTAIQEGDTIQSVYERADEGLYRSQKTGRNRGFWLDSCEWKPFPGPAGPEDDSPEAASSAASKIAFLRHVEEIKGHIASAQVMAPPNSADVQRCKVPAGSWAAQSSESTQSSAITHCPEEIHGRTDDSDILDVVEFVDRLEKQLKQLSRASMSASAIMVEAVGLSPKAVRDFDRSWGDVLEIVHANLRGIDMICRVRQNTLCVCMPGCALSTVLERAGAMQHLLELRRANSAPQHYPKRFAIAAASAQDNEDAGAFLQRLEEALDEAQDASPLEVVVSNPTSSYFYAT
jgi:diguanylate cyclase (GGDEF)-like protein